MIDLIVGDDFPTQVIPYINAATSSIDIIVYDWRWYSSDPGSPCQLFNAAILAAVARSVKVRTIVNNETIKNILKDNGCQSKILVTASLVHVKMMIIDDKYVICGSHNYTQNAFTINLELSVIFDDATVTAQCLGYFNTLFT